jgi:HAD superfamily hydrolase (TIGR01549 family)
MINKFYACYRQLFEENYIQMNVEEAVSILLREHGRAPVFPDAYEVLPQLETRYRIWISSDTDRGMIEPLLKLFKYEHAFVSEEVGAYKQDEHGRFFKHVLSRTNVKPEEILHVGDSFSDIAGANRAGIPTCWINRDSKEWNYEVNPDFIINSFYELLEILK